MKHILFSAHVPLSFRLLASGPYKLLVAASTGDYPAITRLVNEEGISPSHEFQHGVTALHEACEGGHTEAVQMLVDLGADVNKQVSRVMGLGLSQLCSRFLQLILFYSFILE